MKELLDSVKAAYKKISSESSANIWIFAFMAVLLLAILFTGGPSYKVKFNEGDISDSDIYAPYSFTYPGSVDEAKTNEAKEKALMNFLPVYEVRPGYWDKKRETISAFFKELDTVKKLNNAEDSVRIERLKKATDVTLDDGMFLALLGQDISKLEKASSGVLDKISSKIITDDSTIEELISNKKNEITVFNPETGSETKVPRSDLYTKQQIRPVIEKELTGAGIEQGILNNALNGIVTWPLDPSLIYNKAETEMRRKAILEKITPVYSQILVKKNELIIGKGERAAAAHLAQLKQLAQKEEGRFKAVYSAGIAIISIILIIILFAYLGSYRSKIFLKSKNLYLIFTIGLLNAFLAKIIVTSPISLYIMPIATGTMLLAMLLDAGCAFIVAILMSIVIGIISGNKFDVMVVSLIAGMIGVYLVKNVRRRSQILAAGLIVGFAQFMLICGLGLLNLAEPNIFLRDGLWGLASGILSAAIVMLILPVFESLFELTTNITLLELSDLNHPLLRRMVLEAPGTYHHSLIVGNLAEAASEAIGANSLLARVGAYYHDIGKIEKSEYFSENETDSKSYHEGLTPSMSALIITGHVKDGLELAKKYKLNKTLIDFIEQHHGTGLIYYFYQRALEKIDDEGVLEEEGFRYQGPKPQTKETAIVLLADSVEAASRTLDDPTPARIKSLVQKIINNKFIDSQLDECELTLKDMHKISESFARILT
ncbi:MAG: HDIG domain-containing protein, partial [Candidatus Omnitrophica bacterium]|nr:HDIG domain-containing protein [Candidatus Omnitrophota bacterium]